jgi:hypothetical protein
MTETVWNQLYNWKFTSALSNMSGEEPEYALVQALSVLLGDSGWFEGSLGQVVDAMVTLVLHGEYEGVSKPGPGEEPR